MQQMARWYELIRNRVGAAVIGMVSYAGGFALLLGETCGFLAARVRRQHVLQQMQTIGVNSWSIVALINVFLGMVLALQSAYQLQKFGGNIYIAGLVALSVTREIGPILTALILAGRVGASIAAELGTMRVTEQIDALETLATSPVRYLVVPRFIALLVVEPVLTLYADFCGILGGYIVGVFKLNITPRFYWRMTTEPLVFRDVFTGLLKSLVFAVIICIVSCYEGFRTEGGAEGVGRSTTRAVVLSFILIIAADCLLTALFYFGWR